MPFIEHFLSSYPFDYVIGSVHFVKDWDFSNPALSHRLDEFGVNDLYTTYYALIKDAADTGLFDIIGHLDLPKKLRVHPTLDISKSVSAALKAIHRCDLALDVNTSGLRKEAGELYPNEDILREAYTLRIPVCLGSDAHKPGEVAADFEKTILLLKIVGYDQCCVFKQRQCFTIGL